MTTESATAVPQDAVALAAVDARPAKTEGGNGEGRGRRGRGRSRHDRHEQQQREQVAAAPAAEAAALTEPARTEMGGRRYRYPRTPYVPRPRIDGMTPLAAEEEAPVSAPQEIMQNLDTATVPPTPSVPQPVMAAVTEPVETAAITPSPAPAVEPALTIDPPPMPEPAQSAAPHIVMPTPIQIDWSVDLEQIETNPEKLRVAQALAAAEISMPHVKRVRPMLPPVSDEPLVQVETQRTGQLSGTLSA